MSGHSAVYIWVEMGYIFFEFWIFYWNFKLKLDLEVI